MIKHLSYTNILAAFAALLILDCSWLHLTRPADNTLGDALLAQHAQHRPASQDIVIVDIDQKSLTALMGELGNWVWPRSVYAEMLDGLNAQQPRAIVFDIMFNEPDSFRPDSDAAFREAAERHANAYFPSVLLADGHGPVLGTLPASLGLLPDGNAVRDVRAPLLLPVVLPQDAWRGGLINFSSEADGVGRHYLIDETVAPGWRLPSLPARVARDLGWAVPDARQLRLNWTGGHQHVSFSDLYLDFNREHRRRASDEFKNKIILIGTAAPGLQDLRATPLSSIYPGIGILATAFDNLQHGNWLRDAPPWLPALVSISLLALLWLGFYRGINTLWLGFALTGVSVVLVVGSYAALTRNVYWPVGSSLAWGWSYFLLSAMMAYLAEKLRREQAIQLFGRFLDRRVVKQLVESGQIDEAKRAETRQITILFSDIRGFTTLSETRPPEYIVNLLNHYFNRQVDIIFRHGGTLDKFIGDAIMAFWGAPVLDPDHARHAVAAAIEMSADLEAFKKELTDLEADFDIGIGVHTGKAVVGFIGSDAQLSYTVIGDTINLASRIEGTTKGISRVLVSEVTRAACRDEFEFIDHGSHSVKGREQAVQLFEPRHKAQEEGQ
ncbi:Adenylate cyclase 1 [Andreprevotia sp. IGB-42]|uniref:adenylate/guanylate cyclase domain-containing protein n=1 Tax=Andreprevotia sp. IGB-42 TaxID=2497473 RepID=UPI00135C9473|nr:adenylate/guanylate cyclase domain-containing protein [Andreprevotia sp. IGB-42]KAF0812038.1 Adenylate cyclase 1 [Andreprevotia sp. IGB-42]